MCCKRTLDLTISIVEEDNLIDIKHEVIGVAAKWRAVGLALRLKASDLEIIKEKHHNYPVECLTDTLLAWLQLCSNTVKYGHPT